MTFIVPLLLLIKEDQCQCQLNKYRHSKEDCLKDPWPTRRRDNTIRASGCPRLESHSLLKRQLALHYQVPTFKSFIALTQNSVPKHFLSLYVQKTTNKRRSQEEYTEGECKLHHLYPPMRQSYEFIPLKKGQEQSGGGEKKCRDLYLESIELIGQLRTSTRCKFQILMANFSIVPSRRLFFCIVHTLCFWHPLIYL